MFRQCLSLESLDLSNFDTSNVTKMNSMFRECSSLLSLNLSNFVTSNITAMDSMFYGCSSLQSLNLSDFETSNVANMNSMFRGCSNLEYLNLNSEKLIKELPKLISNLTSSNIIIYSEINIYKVLFPEKKEMNCYDKDNKKHSHNNETKLKCYTFNSLIDVNNRFI